MITTDLVGIKGSRNGLLVSIRDDCDFFDGLGTLRQRIVENASFFKGSPVSLDLGWRELREEEFHALMSMLDEHGLTMLGVISSSLTSRRLLEGRGIKVIIGRLGLAQHQGRQKKLAEAGVVVDKPAPVVVETVPEVVSTLAVEAAKVVPVATDGVAPQSMPMPLLGEPAIVLRKTLRSGQRIDFDGNVVILGDVNAGSHVEATGDILVMGSLRGSVHAGVKGRISASVYALGLQAAQLRIAGVVAEVPTRSSRHSACMQARLEGGKVVLTTLK